MQHHGIPRRFTFYLKGSDIRYNAYCMGDGVVVAYIKDGKAEIHEVSFEDARKYLASEFWKIFEIIIP